MYKLFISLSFIIQTFLIFSDNFIILSFYYLLVVVTDLTCPSPFLTVWKALRGKFVRGGSLLTKYVRGSSGQVCGKLFW